MYKKLYFKWKAMKIVYKVIFFITLLLLILILSNCNLIIYGIQQGAGQMRIVRNAEPIEEILNDSLTSDSLRQKLMLVGKIKRYAEDTLGLNPSKNYNTLYDQKGKDILWVVVAAQEFKMETYEWKFPFLGKVPYKGYFDHEKAVKEAKKMKEEGYDARIGTVSAWSTLGFFKDPILSEMLNQNEGMIARLIIHELTHSTLYVKGNSQFNENLATFVGTQGAKQYLIDKYGANSKQYRNYLGELSDIEKFSEHVLKGANLLDSLYAGFSSESLEDKQQMKEELITKIVNDIDTVQFYEARDFSKLKNPKNLPNNAFFVGYITYHKDQDEFSKQFNEEFNSNFREYLQYLKTQYESL
ncbi:MAG: aminopeptidase [Bacteroidetes bacterium]|nr:MAG: aminopeptidase [Bacteroidota bacterium]